MLTVIKQMTLVEKKWNYEKIYSLALFVATGMLVVGTSLRASETDSRIETK
jgi:hypothetical protein